MHATRKPRLISSRADRNRRRQGPVASSPQCTSTRRANTPVIFLAGMLGIASWASRKVAFRVSLTNCRLLIGPSISSPGRSLPILTPAPRLHVLNLSPPEAERSSGPNKHRLQFYAHENQRLVSPMLQRSSSGRFPHPLHLKGGYLARSMLWGNKLS